MSAIMAVDKPEQIESLSIEFPDIPESGIYKCKRFVNGNESNISLLVVLEDEFDNARKSADLRTAKRVAEAKKSRKQALVKKVKSFMPPFIIG